MQLGIVYQAFLVRAMGLIESHGNVASRSHQWTPHMKQTYAQIQKQIAALSREAEKLKQVEVDGVVARIKEAIAMYGLTASDLGLGKIVRATKAKPTKVGKRKTKSKLSTEAKYRNDAGEEWVGRGPRPMWLRTAIAAGKKLEDFAA